MNRTPGRPRVRTLAPDDTVNVACTVTARERDALLEVAGPGGLARFMRRAIRRELALITDDARLGL